VTGQPSLGQQGATNLSGNQALQTIQTLDLAALRQRLLADSNELCNLAPTGSLSLNQGAAVLDASAQSNATSGGSVSGSSSLNTTSGQSNVTIFNLPSSALADLNSVLINGTSQNGFVIINVIDESSTSGGSSGSTGGSSTSGSTGGSSTSGSATSGLNATAGTTLTRFSTNIGSLNSSNLLWNFCNATRLNIDSILVVGTILAPRASVNITSAEIEGGLFAQSLTGNFFNQIPGKFQGVFCSQTSSNTTVSGSSTASSSA
jgi:choice-of-anchor A domain-containing protein